MKENSSIIQFIRELNQFESLDMSMVPQIGLIQVKEEGWTGFSKGWQGSSEGFPEGEAQGKSQGAALPA